MSKFNFHVFRLEKPVLRASRKKSVCTLIFKLNKFKLKIVTNFYLFTRCNLSLTLRFCQFLQVIYEVSPHSAPTRSAEITSTLAAGPAGSANVSTVREALSADNMSTFPCPRRLVHINQKVIKQY